MKISTKGRYAIRVMLDLAINDNGSFIPLKDIAARQEITIKYLEQIISILNKSGYIKSLRGNSGGYRLARKPSEYSLGDILRITEGSIAPIACLDNKPNQCVRCNICPTLPFWAGLDAVISEYVDRFTLEDLLNDQKKVADNNFSI